MNLKFRLPYIPATMAHEETLRGRHLKLMTLKWGGTVPIGSGGGQTDVVIHMDAWWPNALPKNDWERKNYAKCAISGMFAPLNRLVQTNRGLVVDDLARKNRGYAPQESEEWLP